MDKKLYWASIAFAVIGLAVSVYMTIFKLTGNENMCVGNGGCSTVNASPYAEIYGIPVAVIGIVGYLALLVLLLIEPRGNTFLAENGTLIIFGVALLGFLFTLYLIFLEIFVIKALCPFCLTSQISMTILFGLSIARLLREPAD